jgi:plastocyanin
MYRFASVATAAMLVLASCSSSAGTSPTVTDPPVGGDGSEIVIDSFTFAPNLLDVSIGDTIEWKNKQNTAHTSTSGVIGGWSSGVLQEGDSFSFTFTEAGQFPYSCTIHPSMIGVVNVAP